MRMSFVWWNTSLSPLGRPRATEDQMAMAIWVVKYLTETLEVDCLALGEITTADLARFQEEIDLRKYEIYDGTHREGRLLFDTSALSRTSNLNLIYTLDVVSARGNHKLRVAT